MRLAIPLLASASLAAAASPSLTAIVLPQAFADIYGAKCLDGTPPALYIHPGSDKSTFVVFEEGGGWAFDVTPALTVRALFSRAAGGLGSSNGIITNKSTTTVGGLLSTDPAINPRFSNATLVFVHYCDGSSGTSYQAAPLPAPPGLLADLAARNISAPAQVWLRGRANLRATIAYLLSELGMASASTLLLTGGSAGATAVFAGLEFVKGWLPPTLRLLGAPDAGFFLDLPRADNSSDYWYRSCFQAADEVWGGSAAGTVSSPACLAAYKGEPWKCYLAEYAAPFITTPLLLSNSALDMWGLGNVLRLGCIPTMDNKTYNKMAPCAPPQWAQLQGWRAAFHQRLLPLLAARPTTSAFVVDCFVHEINVDYCSSQSLPNCRGWAKYLAAPFGGGGAGALLQHAVGQWVDAALAGAAQLPSWVDESQYPSELRAFFLRCFSCSWTRPHTHGPHTQLFPPALSQTIRAATTRLGGEARGQAPHLKKMNFLKPSHGHSLDTRLLAAAASRPLELPAAHSSGIKKYARPPLSSSRAGSLPPRRTSRLGP